MATEKCITRNTENYCRLAILTAKGCTEILRALVLYQVKVLTPAGQGWTVDDFLSNELTPENKCKLSWKQQRDLCLSGGGPTDITKWDLSLLVVILLDVCKNVNCQVKMDVKKMKDIRNKVCHPGDAFIVDGVFSTYFNQLKLCIERCSVFLNNDDLKTKMDTLVHSVEHSSISTDESVGILKEWYDSDKRIEEHLERQGQDLQTLKSVTGNTEDKVNMIFSKVDYIIKHMPKSDAAFTIPDTPVELIVKNCDDQAEKKVSNMLVDIIDPKLRNDPELKKMLSGPQLDKLTKIVDEAMKQLLHGNREMTDVYEKCVILCIHCPNFESFKDLVYQSVSGNITDMFKPLETAIREMDGYEEVSLEATISDEVFWANMDTIVETILAAYGYTQDDLEAKVCRSMDTSGGPLDDIQGVEIHSSDISEEHAGTRIRINIRPRSVDHYNHLVDTCTSGSMTSAFDNLALELKEYYRLKDLSIEAKLAEPKFSEPAKDTGKARDVTSEGQRSNTGQSIVADTFTVESSSLFQKLKESNKQNALSTTFGIVAAPFDQPPLFGFTLMGPDKQVEECKMHLQELINRKPDALKPKADITVDNLNKMPEDSYGGQTAQRKPVSEPRNKPKIVRYTAPIQYNKVYKYLCKPGVIDELAKKHNVVAELKGNSERQGVFIQGTHEAFAGFQEDLVQRLTDKLSTGDIEEQDDWETLSMRDQACAAGGDEDQLLMAGEVMETRWTLPHEHSVVVSTADATNSGKELLMEMNACPTSTATPQIDYVENKKKTVLYIPNEGEGKVKDKLETLIKEMLGNAVTEDCFNIAIAFRALEGWEQIQLMMDVALDLRAFYFKGGHPQTEIRLCVQGSDMYTVLCDLCKMVFPDVQTVTLRYLGNELKQEKLLEAEDRGQHASDRDLRSMLPVNEGDPDPDRSDTDDSFSSDEEGPPSKLCLRVDQLELAENALMGRNTIICSGTGTGKTWVVLHVVEQHLQQQSNVPRKVAFMARTGVLIKQQSDRFKKFLRFQTKLFSGEEDDTKMINAFLPTCDILCFTPQILLNNLKSGGVASLSEFSLLILDECHHTRGDEPYRNLLRLYLMEKRSGKIPLPQIIGLTASIGVGKARTDEDAVEHLLHVCALLDVRDLSTVERNKEEYLKHTQEPEEQVIATEKPTRDPIKELLKTIIYDTEEKLKDAGIVQPELNELFFEKCPPNKESQEYNKWTVEIIKRVQTSPSIDDDTTRDIIMCAKYLNNYNAALEVNSLLRGSDVGKFLADRSQQEAANKDRLTKVEVELLKELHGVMKKIRKETPDVENPNVIKLTRILRDMLEEKGDDSRAMVFVEARATCKALARILNERLEHVSVRPLYGKETRGFEEGMTQAVQDDTVEKFKSGLYKVLVSTSVGTEGLDVPACNIVISYNYTGNEITKTQMKGRIRKEGGTNVVMGNAKMVEKDLINTYKVAMMHRAMVRVKQLSVKEMEKRISYLQEKELGSYRTKLEIDRYKKSQKSHDDDFEIRCCRCNTFACYTSDVRMLKRQFIVIDKAFADKIITKPHKSPKKYDGFHKKYKMYCKKCPVDWGIVSINQGLPCRILKLECFMLKSLKKGDMCQYKKWEDVPYAVPEIEAADLPKLFGEEATVEDV